MNKTNKYSWLTFIPVGIACFYFYLHTCPYHLLHKEQTTLFVYASEVLYSYLNKPAVLSCLTGDYLTQLFRTPVTASILMGGDYACIGTDLLCRISEMDKRLASHHSCYHYHELGGDAFLRIALSFIFHNIFNWWDWFISSL